MASSGILSIRSYTLTQNSHAHRFNQIVVPLRGSMAITIEARSCSVGVGHCVILPSGVAHGYSASQHSGFLVANMPSLPSNALEVPEPCVAISADLLSFCTYAEVQLTTAFDADMVDL